MINLLKVSSLMKTESKGDHKEIRRRERKWRILRLGKTYPTSAGTNLTVSAALRNLPSVSGSEVDVSLV